MFLTVRRTLPLPPAAPPSRYWSSKMEREGKSPFSDPLAQIGILAILFPFFFLLVAILFGWVDVNGGR